MRAEFEHHKNKDFEALVARVAALEKKFAHLSQTISNLKIPSSVEGGPAYDDKELRDRVAALEAALAELQSSFAHWMKQFQDSLNQKADKTALAEMESTIMLRLNDIVAALSKQFADKAETKKALKLLERQLKNLYDLFMSKG